MAISGSFPAQSGAMQMQRTNSCMNRKQILKIVAVALAAIAAIVSFVFLPWPVGLGFSLVGLAIVPWLFIDCPRIDSARFFQPHHTQTHIPFWRPFSRWIVSDYEPNQGHHLRVGDPYDIPRAKASEYSHKKNFKTSESFMNNRVGLGSDNPYHSTHSNPPPAANLAGRTVVPAPGKESMQNAAMRNIPPNLPPPGSHSSPLNQREVVGGAAGNAPPRLTPGAPQPHSQPSSYVPPPAHHSSGPGNREIVGGDAGKAPPRLTPGAPPPGSKKSPWG
jgi:hypothetical protein